MKIFVILSITVINYFLFTYGYRFNSNFNYKLIKTCKCTLRTDSHSHNDNLQITNLLQAKVSQFSSQFYRYNLIRSYLEEYSDTDFEEIQIAIALSLGFRLNNSENKLILHKDLTPLNWEYIDNIPSFDEIKTNNYIEKKMSSDLPDDNISCEMFLDSICGTETYKRYLKLNDPDINKKMLISNWLFIQGFLNDQFPHTERFIPGHLINNDD